MKKVLIMGLPGAGKTYLANVFKNTLENCAWWNADVVRENTNDWDFSDEGRMRQARRMKTLCDFERDNGRLVLSDFVCPTPQTRQEFDPDIIFWLDTIDAGRFADTNKVFVKPTDEEGYKVITITKFLSDNEISDLAKEYLNNGDKK